MKNCVNFFLRTHDLKRIWKYMTYERSSNSYKSSVELLIALCLFCTDIRIVIVGQKASALSDVGFCPWQGPNCQLIQEGKEMLCFLHNFCFILSLV